MLWQQQIVSSRLLECEVWNRINARRLQSSHGDAVRGLIGRIAIIEMVPPVLRRALEPFHLAAIEFIRAQGANVQLASYDQRLVAIARLLGIQEWDGNQ